MIQHSKHLFILIIALIFISSKINAQQIKVIDNKGTIATVDNNTVTSSNTAPTTPLEGDVWFNTFSNEIKIYDADEPIIANRWKRLSGENLYTKNGTLTGNRDLNGNGKYLRFDSLSLFHVYNTNDIQLLSNNYIQMTAPSGILLNSNITADKNLTVNENFQVKKEFLDKDGTAGTNGQVLSSTGTATKWIDPNLATVINKTTNYTLAPLDDGKVFTFDSATDIILTVPNGLPIGYNISIYQIGIGEVTIQGGATILNRLSRFKTAGKDAGAGLVATGTDIFHLTGDLKI